MNILITSTTFIPSVILCGHCQLDYLEKEGKLNYKFVQSYYIKRNQVEWADIIVFLRSDCDMDRYASKVAKKAGKHLVYVLDDDILNVPSHFSSAPYYSLPSTKRNIRAIMANCDTFLTTSPVLLQKYGGSFNHKFLINEPSINRIDVKEPNDKVKIGFAGSIDRAQDINVILKDTITELVHKYKDRIEIEFMGAKPDFVDELGLTHLPYQDGYDAYTAFMSKCNWDIGLAPMPDTEFHRCKYFNKFVEYASFGIAGVYSNLEPYVYGIKDGENGLLVNNTTKEWVDAVSRLIEDKQLRNRISQTCLKQANEIYPLDACAHDYLKKLMVGYTENKNSDIPPFEMVRATIFFVKIFRKIVEFGPEFPAWAYKKSLSLLQEKIDGIRYNRNKKELSKILGDRKVTFVIAPFFDDTNSYNRRVKWIDETLLSDSFNVYISGEHRLSKTLMVEKIDGRHMSIVFNSFDINQTNEILEMIAKSKNCLIHSVIRFMREKISTEMYRLFDDENVEVTWDTHGDVPGYYHENQNYHTESVTREIEKNFYNNVENIIVSNENEISGLIEKYGSFKGKSIICIEEN